MNKLIAFFGILLLSTTAQAAPIKALIVDGQNNHEWKKTTPLLKQYLEETGLFQIDVATTPEGGGDLSGFKPNFAKYKVIVSNYNDAPWSAATKKAFEEYVRNGGGFVSVHAADNSFPEWKEYNRMIGVGGYRQSRAASAQRISHREKREPAEVAALARA